MKKRSVSNQVLSKNYNSNNSHLNFKLFENQEAIKADYNGDYVSHIKSSRNYDENYLKNNGGEMVLAGYKLGFPSKKEVEMQY